MSNQAKVLSAGMFALATLVLQNAATAALVDFNTFTVESYTNAQPGFADTPNWQVFDSGRIAAELANSTATVFYGQQSILNKHIRGFINSGNDDDYMGIALGFNPGNATGPGANFILLDWKGVNQTFDYTTGIHDLTVGSTAQVGLAISRVQGIPTNDELWGHDDQAGNPGGSVTELARGATRGATAYSGITSHELDIIYESNRIQVFVNNQLEIDIAGNFGDGRLGMYELSQSPGAVFGEFDISNIGAARPIKQAFTAGLLNVAPAAIPGSPTNAESIWTVVGTGVGAHRMAVISSPNIADVEIAFDHHVPLVSEGIMMLTVAENGPREGQPGVFGTATASFAHGGWGQNRYGISTYRTNAQNAEGNINVAAAFFPFDQGAIGATINGTGTSTLTFIAGQGVTLANITQVASPSAVDQNGIYNIVIPGENSATDGLFFAVAASNSSADGTYASATRNGTGGWRIGVRDHANANNSTNSTFEHDAFSFVYIPIETPRLVGAHVTGFDGGGVATTDITAGKYSLTRVGVGEYLLLVEGHTPNTGVLMLTASTPFTIPGGPLVPLNQYLTYEAFGNGFLINLLQLNIGVVTPVDGQFYFMFLPFQAAIPEPATAGLALAGLIALAGGRRRARRLA